MTCLVDQTLETVEKYNDKESDAVGNDPWAELLIKNGLSFRFHA